MSDIFLIFAGKLMKTMEENKPIDGAEYISLEEAKRLKLPYFEGAEAGFPSPAADYQHESLDLNEKFVHHPEASYFVRVKGESMIGLGILDGDICLADRQEEISDGHIVVAFVNGGLTVKTLDTSTRDKGYLRLLPANPDFKPIIIDANDQFIIQGRVTSIHRDIRRH
jgi:DNA polymerase V